MVQYSGLRLTNPADKLPAISALAEILRRGNQQQYLAGLWGDSLLVDMCWELERPFPWIPQWRAPTWSWASVDGPITYHQGLYVREGPVEQRFQVVNAECSLADPSPTGRVLDGFVKLSCILVSVHLHPTINIKLVAGTEELYWRNDGRRMLKELRDLYIIPLVTVAESTKCLVVTPKDRGQPDMVRVGLAGGWKSLCDSWEKERRTVRIV